MSDEQTGEGASEQEEDRPGASSRGPASPAPPPHGAVRYTRRRLLVLGGSLVAGVAAVAAGLRAFGGRGADTVGGAFGDRLGTFPVRSVEVAPDVSADEWVVRVDGLVETPLVIDRGAWQALRREHEVADFHCVEGWSVDDVRWGGVEPAVLLEQAGVRPEARYAVFHAHGGVYLSSLPLELVRDAQTLLADTLDDAPLPPRHGGPLRLVVPKQLGYKSVKWVTRIELSTEPRPGYWESRGYPEDAPAPGA